MSPKIFAGGCPCGANRYRSDSVARYMCNCHCRDCQKTTESAYFLALLANSALSIPFSNLLAICTVMKVLHYWGEQIMDCYIAELDETKRIAAVWVKKKAARGPSVFDPKMHIFDLRATDEFVGAPRHEIVSWIKAKQQTS